MRDLLNYLFELHDEEDIDLIVELREMMELVNMNLNYEHKR
jgi:hypothetical protein